MFFAGAGVSMGAPSNLDNFIQLAKKIGEGAPQAFTDKDEEYPEIYLGKLKSSKVKIYDRLHSELQKPGSTHTPLHCNICRLFNGLEKSRIITTNYDLHFKSAFEEVYDKKPQVYISPALPLGKSFSGIIHIHGALGADTEGIVLTDDDFGRAYLTEGWARRFLRDVFENNTVLFVGYSHDDTVMKYLARGLPPSDDHMRYVLVGEKDKSDHWKHLGIQPIYFPQKNNSDFSTLYDSIEQLAKLNASGALDLEKRISEIVSTFSELDEESESQLKWYLGKEHTTRFFTKHAKDVEWLNWAFKNGYLNLISKQGELDEREKLLASWFSNFCVTNYQKALEIFNSESKNSPNTQLIRSIASQLIFADSQTTSKEIYASWLSVLYPYISYWHQQIYPQLFENLTKHNATEILVYLFKLLTEPKVNIKKYFSFGFDEDKDRIIDYEIYFYLSEYLARIIVNKHLIPAIEDTSIDLINALIDNLNKVYLLNKSLSKSNENFDGMSSGRSAIESHEQDKYPDTIDVLIDATRDVLEYFIKTDPDYANTVIESLLKFESKLLIRIAIHGLCEIDTLTSKEKIYLIIENGWLIQFQLKHEVYRLISNEFPQLEDAVKKDVINQFFNELESLLKGQKDDEKEKDIAYQKFNLLSWLHKHDKDCIFINEHLKEIKEEHPNFKPREYLDLTSWTTSGSNITRSKTIQAETLLSKKPKEVLDIILEELPEEDYEKRDSLYGLTKACNENPDWCSDFAKEILKKGIKDNFLIDAVLNSWIDEGIKNFIEDDHYKFISDEKIQEACVRELSRHFYSLYTDKNVELDQEELNRLEELVNSLWKFANNVKSGVSEDSWLGRAINHPAGNLVLTWIKIISADLKLNNEEALLTDKIFQERFSKIVNEESARDEYGIAILGSQFAYLYGIKREWATENLLPLFDFNKSDNAEMVWDGWLSWGRLTYDSGEALFPYYKSSIPFLAQNDFKKNMRFSIHLAELVLFHLDDPIDDILNDFFSKADQSSRIDLINQIGHRLGHLEPKKQEHHWNIWIQKFIHNRIQSIPIPLTPGEYEGILSWLTHLKPVFAEAVTTFLEAEPQSFKHSSVFSDLLDSELFINKTDEVINLLLHVLEVDLEKYFCYHLKKLYEEISQQEKSEDIFRELGNRLAKLGCI